LKNPTEYFSTGAKKYRLEGAYHTNNNIIIMKRILRSAACRKHVSMGDVEEQRGRSLAEATPGHRPGKSSGWARGFAVELCADFSTGWLSYSIRRGESSGRRGFFSRELFSFFLEWKRLIRQLSWVPNRILLFLPNNLLIKLLFKVGTPLPLRVRLKAEKYFFGLFSG